MRRLIVPLLLLTALGVSLLWAGEYGYGPLVITREGEYKIIIGLFGPKAVLTEPGWDPTAWKFPIIDEVHVFDNRLQYLNAKPVRVLIANNENLIVDYYAIWRITEPLAFLENFPNGVAAAESRIQEVVKSLVGSEIGGLNLQQILERAEILSQLHVGSSERLAGTGVEVVDVRLNRTELPPNAVPAAYAQMREQRRALSREHRARGDRKAREIRAEANRNAVSTRATAQAEAERVRGEGDAKSTRIYADAYSKNPEFYAFTRSLEAYRKTISTGTTLVVSDENSFFRYLNLDESDDDQADVPATRLPPVSTAAPITSGGPAEGQGEEGNPETSPDTRASASE